MKVRALRGVCIGVDRHLKPGDTEDLDAAMVTYLVGIGAVELVPDEPTPVEKAEPADAGQLDLKPGGETRVDETEVRTSPKKSGKKDE